MRNHDQKTKDMVRSVLPSTRSVAVQRRHIHHAERSAVRQRLHVLRNEADIDTPYLEGHGHRIHEMVQDRRLYDKTAPLIRWATRRIETDPRLRELPLEAQLAHFRALLPANLIGEHALFHLEWALERRH